MATIIGTEEDDALVGTPDNDLIRGLDGLDDISGEEGDDTIDDGGGAENVVLYRGQAAGAIMRRVTRTSKTFRNMATALALAAVPFVQDALAQDLSAPSLAAPLLHHKCPVKMVPAGPLCVDTYEASVWSRPPGKNGEPRGTQFGVTGDDYPCSFNGDDCAGANPIFAVSAPGVMPSTFITWFQAQQACANVGKRLPTNAEWQIAAAGTPDTGGADDGATTCNTDDLVPGASRTGSRQDCVSDRGAFDMVGNVLEWVADWIQGDSVPFEPSGSEHTLGPDFGDDFMRGINPATVQPESFPSAIERGGSFRSNTGGGVFTLRAQGSPATIAAVTGFRCVLPR